MQPFSLFLPVYNEESILAPNTEKLWQYVSTLHVPFEIIIGSNGSTDQTVTRGEQMQRAHPEVHFFHLPHKGPGDAFRKAAEMMRYDVLICLDMDLPVNLDFIARAAELLDQADVVVGSKKTGSENRSLFRRGVSGLFIACSKQLLRLPFDDYSLGAKAYRKSVLEHYPEAIVRGTFYVQNLVYRAFRDGLNVAQIAVDCVDHRKSRFNLGREGIYRFGCLFLLWLTAGRAIRSSHRLTPPLTRQSRP